MENLSFYYDIKKKILDNVSLEINKGDKIILTGESGSGKSTLIKIILGFLNPSEGNIKIDDHCYKSLTPEMWKDKASYVPQEIFLFDSSFTENITFEEEYDIDKVNLISKITHLSDLKKDLEFQGNPNLGDGENKVSGGQKQRIGIARALYKNPDLLIFDESTSSLDKKTEEDLLKNVLEHSVDKTIIFITHNLKLEKYFKKINLKNGKIYKKKVRIAFLQHQEQSLEIWLKLFLLFKDKRFIVYLFVCGMHLQKTLEKLIMKLIDLI